MSHVVIRSHGVGSRLGMTFETDDSVGMLYFTTCSLSWKVDINLERKRMIENTKYSFKF